MSEHDDEGADGPVDADVLEQTEPNEDDGTGGKLSVETCDKVATSSVLFRHVHQVQDRTNEQQQETNLETVAEGKLLILGESRR